MQENIVFHRRFSVLHRILHFVVMVGFSVLGLTGIFLWFPEFFSLFLPGFFINIARILHFYEALMAIVVKFFIHVGMAHLRPSVYPGDRSIFSGKTTEDRMRTEHAGEWERLRDQRSEVKSQRAEA